MIYNGNITPLLNDFSGLYCKQMHMASGSVSKTAEKWPDLHRSSLIAIKSHKSIIEIDYITWYSALTGDWSEAHLCRVGKVVVLKVIIELVVSCSLWSTLCFVWLEKLICEETRRAVTVLVDKNTKTQQFKKKSRIALKGNVSPEETESLHQQPTLVN